MQIAKLGIPGAILVRTAPGVRTLIEDRRTGAEDRRRQTPAGARLSPERRAWFFNVRRAADRAKAAA